MKFLFKSINIYNDSDLFSDLKKENETYFQNYCTISFQTFHKLLEIIINNYYIIIYFGIKILKKLIFPNNK